MNDQSSMTLYGLSPEDVSYYENQRKRRRLHVAAQVLIYAILILWAALALVPFVWVFLSSFKSKSEILAHPLLFDFSQFSGNNYKLIFAGSTNVFTGYGFSFLISGLVVVLTVLSSLLAAFVMARFNFPGKAIVNALIVAGMMFPSYSLMIPIVRILDSLHMYGHWYGVVFPQVALNMGFTIILLTGFLKGIPIEVEEAAHLDGASIVRILFQICLPMAKSAIVTCCIFVFLWSYNDLFLQMIIITNQDETPISLLLNKLATKEYGLDNGKMAAAVTIVALPIMVVYLFFQQYIIKGLTAGAVKG